MANTCNLAEINAAALKVYNEDLVARDAATEAPTAQTMEPTAAPESDAADRVALLQMHSCGKLACTASRASASGL